MKGPIIRIESDGLPYGTKITPIESGVDLSPGIRSITWRLEAGNIAEVSVETIDSRIEFCGAYTQVDIRGTLKSIREQVVDEEDKTVELSVQGVAKPLMSMKQAVENIRNVPPVNWPDRSGGK